MAHSPGQSPVYSCDPILEAYSYVNLYERLRNIVTSGGRVKSAPHCARRPCKGKKCGQLVLTLTGLFRAARGYGVASTSAGGTPPSGASIDTAGCAGTRTST